VESSELTAKLEKVEQLERQIDDQKFKISQLREEKVRMCFAALSALINVNQDWPLMFVKHFQTRRRS